MKKLRSGIKIITEIEGYGEPIKNKGRFDAVIKFFKNKGDPLEFNTILQDPIPYIKIIDGVNKIAWHSPIMHTSNVIFVRNACLAREADLLPGIYYSILGMKNAGYRHVSIPPHLMARSILPMSGLDENSIVKAEIFMMRITDFGSDQ